MSLNIIQSGYDLEIDTATSETPPQFTRGGLCSVQLTDDTFDGLDKMVLLFAPDDGRRHAPAVVELSKTDSDGMHYSGAFTRASMLHDGPVLVVLAGTTSTQTITSNAYRITVRKSLDPEAGMLAEPATLADVVAAAVDSWLQANGIPTDSTLSVAGKPADAAATGEKLSQLTEEIGTKTSDLKSDLDNVLVTNIDAEFTINDNYIDKDNGELISDSTYESTDFIEIPALATGLKFDVTFKSPRSGEYNAFYDKDKKFISNFSYGKQITGIQEVHISENAKYFRLSKHKTEVIINTITAMYDRKIADTVSELGDTVSELQGNLPPYLKDEFNSTLNTVTETIQNKNNLTVIGVMTDLHFSSSGSGYYENELRTGVFNAAKALAKMTTKIPFDIVAFLGDYMQLPNKDSGQTKEMGISNLMDVNRMLSKMNAPTMAISGNHEGNYTGDGTGYGLSDSEIYNYLLKKSILTNKAVRHNNDYYVDDTASLTRHVFIDGRVVTENENTKNWLKNVVSSNLPDGYSIIVYSHYSMDSTSVLTYVKDYIDAIIQGGHTPILWIGGHWHADRHDTYNGCLVVSLLQSGLWSSEPSEDGTTYNHTVGTATESAFTVFIVDRDNKKVNLIRFGLGNDYEYTLS